MEEGFFYIELKTLKLRNKYLGITQWELREEGSMVKILPKLFVKNRSF